MLCMALTLHTGLVVNARRCTNRVAMLLQANPGTFGIGTMFYVVPWVGLHIFLQKPVIMQVYICQYLNCKLLHLEVAGKD